MTTGILIALTVALLAAACYVGLLLLRRSRPATRVDRTPTVGDLVRRRSTKSDGPADAGDLSGADLFTPKDPQAKGVVPPPPDDVAPSGPGGADVAIARPTPRPAATPPGGVEVGDAPWRRAARMMGSEPGGAWETAPIPVVPAAEPVRVSAQAGERAEAGRTAVLEVPAPVGAHRQEPDRQETVPDEAGRTAVIAVPEQTDASPVEGPVAEPADEPAAEPVDEPVAVDPTSADPTSADPTSSDTAADDAVASVPDAPSRPMSDPDLTPLMGIPLVRPVAEGPVPSPAAAESAAEEPEPERGPQPVTPRLSRPSAIDDEVVSMLPAAGMVPSRPAVTGSSQPVWFRVVRRDGEPVGGVLVSLLDDRGQEADATKTATDGGGELHAPHGGWFLMIASAEGFQPRAVTLAVDEQPVEIALLLPRSATVAGSVRDGGAPAAGTRVVAFQEGEVVDELVTDRDGGFRFDDLAEGVYALSASGARGSAVGRVTLSEGADVQLDLDLLPPDSAG